MRLLLVLVLVNGLVPDLAEVGEAVVHYARTGHVAHSVADHGDLGDQGDEHGCGTLHHRCACCDGQPVLAPSGAAVAAAPADPERAFVPSAARLTARAPERPFRPPIA